MDTLVRRGARRTLLCALFFLLSLAIFPTASALAAGTVTVNLLNHDSSAGLPGAVVQYYHGGWQSLGTTDNNGSATANVNVTGTTDIQISYAGGTYKWTNVDPATTHTLTINTVQVTVKLETCGGTPLVGDAQYYFHGFQSIGSTAATVELLPYSGLGPGQGNYDFQVKYNGRTCPAPRCRVDR